MKIVNMDKVEESIKRHREYEHFYDYPKTCLDEALEPLQTNPSIRLAMQIQGPRTMSKFLYVKYGSPLYWSIMECIEGEMNRIEDELSDF